MDAPATIPLAPAYSVKCSAKKLEGKDLNGKSGMLPQVQLTIALLTTLLKRSFL